MNYKILNSCPKNFRFGQLVYICKCGSVTRFYSLKHKRLTLHCPKCRLEILELLENPWREDEDAYLDYFLHELIDIWVESGLPPFIGREVKL